MTVPRGNFHVLLVFLLLLVVTLSFLSPGPGGRIFLAVVVGGLFFAAIFGFSHRRGTFLIGIVLAAISLAASVAAILAPGRATAIARQSCTTVFLGFTVGVLLTTVLSSGRVTANKLSGAVCVFLLIGIVFAGLFSITELVAPGSLSGPPSEADSLHQALSDGAPDYSMTYFSFVTLTTLGYGDMLPVSRVARMLAWVEAVVGQLYLTILVARLVGMHLARAEAPEGR